MKLGKFKYKCICMWSKNDEYGFIPNIKCPAHRKSANKILKNSKPYIKAYKGKKTGDSK